MKLNITTNHFSITDGMSTHIKEKLKKITKHFNGVVSINIILEVTANKNYAEGTVHMSGFDVFAKASGDDMYIAIDQMINKLDVQVIKHKQKIQSHRGQHH